MSCRVRLPVLQGSIISRVNGECFIEAGQSILISFHLPQDDTFVIPGGGILWLDLCGIFKAFQGAGKAAFIGQSHALSYPGIEI